MLLSKSLQPEDYAEIQDGLAEAYENYARLVGRGIGIEMPHAHRFWEYGSALQATPWGAIETAWDAGAGYSLLGPTLAKRGIVVHECDLLQRAVDTRPPEVIASVSDLASFPGKFDAVYCMSVLEHLEWRDQPAALERLMDAAKKLLVITVDYGDGAEEFGNPCDQKSQFFKHDIERMVEKIAKDFRLEWDLTFHGKYVFDYTFFRIVAWRKQRTTVDGELLETAEVGT